MEQQLVKPFDQLAHMSRQELEFHWLAMVFWRTSEARLEGLLGLDASMFESPTLFELGLKMLRSKMNGFATLEPVDEEIANELAELQLLGLISGKAFEWTIQIEGFYRRYAREIEHRADKRWEIPWSMT